MSDDPTDAPDLLRETAQRGEYSRSDMAAVMERWLSAQFMADRWAKLDQAKVPEAQKTRIARVYTDIGATSERPHADVAGVLVGLLSQASLDRIYLTGRWIRQVRSSGGNPNDPRYFRTGAASRGWGDRLASAQVFGGNSAVLIGGPGQGKSTLTQMLAQCHRSALLLPRIKRIRAEVAAELRSFEADLTGAKLHSPARLMMPVRIDLARFASWLAEHHGSVPGYLAFEVMRFTGSEITARDAETWLRGSPWLLLLDGLDEVPAGAGRDRVIRSVNESLVSFDGLEGQVIVTTRPQGYRGEFGGLRHLRLAPFDRQRAELYASRLVAERYADQPDERESVTERLKEALDDETTARLLQTPLQITIMAALVAQIGRAPRERWRLFSEYYRAVYNRETAKGGDLAKLLSTQRQHVDAIHRHVGLLLQVSSEHEGETEAMVSTDTLRAVARARFDSEGYEPKQAEDLSERIVRAALDRLVFLVELQQGGRLGFEIRSLQEYMAAWALTLGTDQEVLDRMRVIAPSAHWRNVYVLAVGRVLEDGATSLRDAVTVGVCERMNTGGGDVAAGSHLALELLNDRTILVFPRAAEQLVALVLDTLDRVDPDFSLEVLLDPAVDEALHVAPRLRVALELLAQTDSLLSWDYVWGLSVRGNTWADAMARRNWPTNHAQAAQIVMGLGLIFEMASRDGGEIHVENIVPVRPGDLSEPWSEFVRDVPDEHLVAEWNRPSHDGATEARFTPPEPTPLANYAVWLRLGLPDPPPRLASSPTPDGDFSPVVRRIAIQGVRALADVSFTLPALETPDEAQCVVVLGENGTGKTTLLRAIAFALIDPTIADVALQQSVSRYLNLTEDTQVAHCVVETAQGIFHTELASRNGLEVARGRLLVDGRRPFVLAYGCRRGSAMGSPDRDPAATPFDDVGNLFDRPWGLVHAEAWLRNLHGGTNGDALMFEAVTGALMKVLPGVDALFFHEATLRARGTRIGEVDFAALSDGYLTTAGLVVDIFYRWKLRAARLGQKLAANFTDTMTGVVLVDEIDLHLHPKWQRHVLADLRAALPRVTFIVTTHNPVTLVGASTIVQLKRGDDGAVSASRLDDDTRLMTGSELYATFFGLDRLHLDTLGEDLRRYGYIAGDPARTDDEERELHELRARLKRGGIAPEWEPVPREEAPHAESEGDPGADAR